MFQNSIYDVQSSFHPTHGIYFLLIWLIFSWCIFMLTLCKLEHWPCPSDERGEACTLLKIIIYWWDQYICHSVIYSIFSIIMIYNLVCFCCMPLQCTALLTLKSYILWSGSLSTFRDSNWLGFPNMQLIVTSSFWYTVVETVAMPCLFKLNTNQYSYFLLCKKSICKIPKIDTDHMFFA